MVLASERELVCHLCAVYAMFHSHLLLVVLALCTHSIAVEETIITLLRTLTHS